MWKKLSEAEPAAFAALRIVSGALFLVHGLQKLFNWPPGGHPVVLMSQVGLGGVIELVGGALIAVGLFTRAAAFIAAGMMAVAYFQFHWKLAFANAAWLPVVNRGELAVVYCFVFLFIATRGAGIVSIDNATRRA